MEVIMEFLSTFKRTLAPTLLVLALCTTNVSAMLQKKTDHLPKQVSMHCLQDENYAKTRTELYHRLYTTLTSLPQELIDIMVNYALPRVYGTCAQKIKASFYPINSIAVVSPTTIAFSIRDTEETAITIFNVTTKESHCLTGHESTITGLAVLSEHSLATSSDDAIKIWNIDTKKETCSINVSAQTIAKLPHNRLVSGATDGSINVWSAVDGTPIRKHYGCRFPVQALVVFPDEQIAALTGTSYTHMCDPFDSRLDQTIDVPFTECLTIIEPNTLAVGTRYYDHQTRNPICENKSSAVILTNRTNGRTMAIMRGHKDTVTCLATIGKTGYILSASIDQTLKIWNPEVKQCVATINLPNTPTSLVVLPDGKNAIVGDNKGWLLVIGLSFE